ncbi:MAG: hypothetical protein NW205_02890 [Hyphomicrobiaceae bacterium]|nr:hypothetical protein [Hyphomicrobiaceae bacterium]
MLKARASPIASVALAAIACLAAALAAASPASAQGAAGPVRAAEKSKPPFPRAEDVLEFIAGYREAKSPDRLPAAVAAMLRHGLLKDPEKAGIYTGFIAGVLGENGVRAERLVTDMFPMPPVEQIVLVKAIAYSGLPYWKQLLSSFVERMPSRQVLIAKYLYGDGKTLDELAIDDDFLIDVLWGQYFATGAADPARRLVSVLALAEDGDDIEKLTLGAMAKFTLASNAARDKRLLDIAKGEMNSQPENVRRHLREVIEAAELYELAKLRQDAFTSIEEIRTRGTASRRAWHTWGEAGTTVLALGCVAASALGQFQFGIPCVVGGALSSAAVRYLGPDR